MRPTRSGRAMNLKIFGHNRFLYSKLYIDDQLVVDVEKEIVSIVKLASSLAPVL